MHAEKLRHRVTILRPVKERTPAGQRTADAWEPVCTTWAQIKCTAAKAVTAEGITLYTGEYKIFIRWRPGLAAGMRVQWGQRVFELTAPPADWETEKSGLTLITKEVTAHGQKADR